MKMILALATLALCSCVTTVTETTATDGSYMKVTTTQPATGSIEAATIVAAIAVDQFSTK